MFNETLVIGGDGSVGETLARRLTHSSAVVLFLGEDEHAVERATAAGVDARLADPSETAALDREAIESMGTAIVASRTDRRNLLVAQLLGCRRTERVIALVNVPRNVDAFAAAGIEPVCAATTLASALARQRHDGKRPEIERQSEQAAGESSTEQSPKGSADGSERERLRSDGTGGDR
ncbi:NAD-binding protein [Halococcus thailandensis]|uniref:TrkA-domain-containing protein n=1 Tax=Halococcus thailandensis JCM 13552 TaxID=1227457 RepID=M0N0Q0_9EURY|nr:NAD-binding protein [Halococcus thailandensis]EMA51441.1 TrkA-domain-containing protein [Halococcus thailandensis JCM 13552]